MWAPPPPGVDLDPLALLVSASGPALLVNWTLIAAAAAVWIVAVLKLRQLGRLAAGERLFEVEATQAHTAGQLAEIARRHRETPGARVVRSLVEGAQDPELAEARARRALVAEEQRTGALLGVLSTVGAAAPFVGLFGTVWGILGRVPAHRPGEERLAAGRRAGDRGGADLHGGGPVRGDPGGGALQRDEQAAR